MVEPRVSFFLVIAISFCRLNEISGSEICVPNKKWNNVKDTSFVEIEEDTHLFILKTGMLGFPNKKYWMWFQVPPELQNATQCLSNKIYRVITSTYYTNLGLAFEAADCDWLASLFTSNITCACTLPSHLGHYFRFSFNVSYAFHHDRRNMVILVIEECLNKSLLAPRFLPEEKKLVMLINKQVQDEAIENYPPLEAVTSKLHCTDYNQTEISFTYVKLSTEKTTMISDLRFGQTDFIIDYGVRENLTHIVVAYLNSACGNMTSLWLYEQDKPCSTDIILENHPVFPTVKLGKLPYLSKAVCNCTPFNGFTDRYWRMSVHLNTHNYLCLASFGFSDVENAAYGIENIQTVVFYPEKNTNLHNNYYTEEFMYGDYTPSSASSRHHITVLMFALVFIFQF